MAIEAFVKPRESLTFRIHPALDAIGNARNKYAEHSAAIDEDLLQVMQAAHERHALTQELHVAITNEGMNPQKWDAFMRLEDRMETTARQELTKRFSDGLQKIKELETNLAAVAAVPSLMTPEELKKTKHALAALRGHRTRHKNAIDPVSLISQEEQKLYQELKNENEKYTWRRIHTLQDRVSDQDDAIQKAIVKAKTNPIVRAPEVFGYMDGDARPKIDYRKESGKRIHDGLFLLWDLPKDIITAQAIVRHEITQLIKDGQWKLLGGGQIEKIFDLHIVRGGYQYTQALRRTVAETLTDLIIKASNGNMHYEKKKGKTTLAFDAYIPQLEPMSIKDIADVFDFMKQINNMEQRFLLGPKNKEDNHTTTNLKETALLAKDGYLSRAIRTSNVTEIILSVPGLNIDMAMAIASSLGGVGQSRTGMGLIDRFTDLVSTTAKKDPRYKNFVVDAKTIFWARRDTKDPDESGKPYKKQSPELWDTNNTWGLRRPRVKLRELTKAEKEEQSEFFAKKRRWEKEMFLSGRFKPKYQAYGYTYEVPYQKPEPKVEKIVEKTMKLPVIGNENEFHPIAKTATKAGYFPPSVVPTTRTIEPPEQVVFEFQKRKHTGTIRFAPTKMTKKYENFLSDARKNKKLGIMTDIHQVLPLGVQRMISNHEPVPQSAESDTPRFDKIPEGIIFTDGPKKNPPTATGDTQWSYIMDNIGDMARKGDERVRSYIQNISASKTHDPNHIEEFMDYVLQKLKPRDSEKFEYGWFDSYDLRRQLAHRWIQQVDSVILGTLNRYTQTPVALENQA